MYVLIDKRNLQLRGVFNSKSEVNIQDDKVVTPLHIIMDLNTETAMVNKYEGTIPNNWKSYEYYYDRNTDKFRRTMRSNGKMIFINE